MKYCNKKGLIVNKSKTKIMAFTRSGRVKRISPQFRIYDNSEIEVVKNYNYLGILLTSAGLGRSTVQAVITKANTATSISLGILYRSNCQCWNAHMELYHSMVTSIALYAFPAWGINYGDLLEKIQTEFFKKALHLPRCIPAWAIRMELNILPLKYQAMKNVWNWYIKILESNDSYLPKVCLKRLIALVQSCNTSIEYNWALQLKSFLTSKGNEKLIDTYNVDDWKKREKIIFMKYKDSLVLEDYNCYKKSHYAQLKIFRHVENDRAAYFCIQSMVTIRTIAQIRLASKYASNFTLNKSLFKINPTKNCRCCGLHKPETIEHLLLECPAYNRARIQTLTDDWRTANNSFVSEFFNNLNYSKCKMIFAYFNNCFLIRNFILEE